MSKRAAKKQPVKKSKNKESMLWLEVIELLKQRTESQQHRLQILATLPGWLEFSSSWIVHAPMLLEFSLPLMSTYTGSKTKTAYMHFWAWAQIEETGAVDALLSYINETIPMSSADMVQCFDTMYRSYLIHPDGSINPLIRQRVHDASESKQSIMSISASSRFIKAVQLASQLDKLTSKHEYKFRSGK